MPEPDILQEIHDYRAAFAAAHGYDVYAMGETLRQQQAESGVPTVSFPPRPPVVVEPLPQRTPQVVGTVPATA